MTVARPVRLCVTAIVAAGLYAQTWTHLTPTGTAPSPRFDPTSVYDAASDQMIVFAGRDATGNRNDVWSLAGIHRTGPSFWTNLAPLGGTPSPRRGHTAVYDPTNSRMIVFGGGLGGDSPCANDLWVLYNANSAGGSPTWTQLSPSGPAPGPRFLHTAVYDVVSNSMIVFGGGNCFSTFYNDVWVLSNANGLGGTPVWTQLAPSGVPPAARNQSTAVYDSASNTMIVYGGNNPVGQLFGDMWLLSNANGIGGTPAWTQVSSAGANPGARTAHSAIFDPAASRMTIFGGYDGVNFLNDSWELDHANGVGGTPTWTQLGPFATLPPGRFGHSAILDSSTGAMAIFGGSAPGMSLNDVWVLGSEPSAPLYSICLLYDSTRPVKSGSTLPIKIQLCDSNGQNLSAATLVVHAISVTKTSTNTSAELQDAGNANPDNDFRFDSTLGQTGGYIFNLSTKGLSTGTYNLNFQAGSDATTYVVPFEVK